MTPRQRAIEALERRRPPGSVPSCELYFGLYEEWLGEPIRGQYIPETVRGAELRKALREFARDTAEVYRQMDHCIITHWCGRPQLLEAYREETGDEFMLGFPADGTFGIPDGTHMEEFVYGLTDDPQGMHDKAARDADQSIAVAAVMKAAGGDVVWMGSDYAMNEGPLLSPAMFEEFVAPYLKRCIDGYRDLGLYVIKHSDGDINPILQMMVEAGPHAIHSLDTVAGMDIREVKRQYGDRVALMGNVAHGPLQLDRRDEIESSALYCLEHGGVEAGGYIYSTSNAVMSGAINGITIDAYRFMLSVRDRYMASIQTKSSAESVSGGSHGRRRERL